VAAGHPFWISRQIVRDYLAVMSRQGTITAAPSRSALLADAQRFLTGFQVAEDGPAVTTHLLSLLKSAARAGKQVYDANIVATMLTHGIPALLTDTAADFTRFAGCITVMPLVP
jgi:predicted nucleic acid-binding protein